MSQYKFIELVTKEFIDVLTEDEANKLKSLLQDSKLQNQYDLFKLYLSAENLDHSSDDAVFQKVQQKIQEQEEHLVPTSRGSKKAFYWKVAVAAMFTVVSLTIYSLYQREAPVNQQISTNRAVKKRITLSDGSTVVLNSESKLHYPEKFTGERREVTLIGEGFFDIVKDPDHPFIIHTKKMNIRVLGTAFNVKAYPDDRFSETTLIRGLIEVTLKDRPTDRITLHPSEKLVVSNISVENTPKRKETLIRNEALTQVTHFQKSDSTVMETSWMFNKVIFKNQSLSEISTMLERAYDVDIDFRNESVKELKFTGVFEKESVEDILKTLSLIEPFSYKIHKNQIVIN
ncbi:MAG: FecR family protein [Pyrinomonadaceae bacterium]|nr:FecR family protein [Sphingobacteriaceae bacterium]